MVVGKNRVGPDLAAFGEVDLIERLRKKLSVTASEAVRKTSIIEGIGDDAAVLRWENGDTFLLLTCDTLVEKVHFPKGTPPDRIGWKAMACNLSDIAAMGGIPQYAVVSLACPAGTKVAEIDSIYAGMTEVSGRFEVAIVGGDTVESPRALMVTVTVIGRVEKRRYVVRSGAKPGDVLCVTGDLGGSLLGKHLAFLPRVAEGRFLAANFSPTAMIDISDGLASDLTKVVQASHTTAELFAEHIPVSDAANRSAKRRRLSPLEMALHDGEDFELLFTLPREKVDRCLSRFRKHFSTPITVIGRIKRGRRRPILVHKDGTTAPLEARGYEHFRKSGWRTTAPSARRRMSR